MDSVYYWSSIPRNADWPVSSVTVSSWVCVCHVSSTGNFCFQVILKQGGRLSHCQDSHGSVVPIGNTLILSGWFTNLPGTGVPWQEVAVCSLTIFAKYPNVLDNKVFKLLEMGVICEMGQVQVSMLIHTLQYLNLRKSWLLESIPGKFNNYACHIYFPRNL